MFRCAPDHDLIRTAQDRHGRIAGQRFPQAQIGIQSRAALVKYGNLQVGAQLNAAPVRRLLPQKSFDQCGFSNPIRANKRDTIFALNCQRKILQNLQFAEGQIQVFSLNDLSPRFLTRLKCHGGRGLPVDLRSPLGTQFPQCPHAALIAFAPRRNTLHRPAGFRFDFAIEFVPLLIFFFPGFITPRFKASKPLLQAANRTSVNPQGCAG